MNFSLTKRGEKKAKSTFTLQRKVQLQYYVKVHHKMIHPSLLTVKIADGFLNGKSERLY